MSTTPASLTASALFAQALGLQLVPGAHWCHLCGATCDDHYKVTSYPRAVPANLHPVKGGPRNPGGGFLCAGCAHSVRPRVEVRFPGGGHRLNQEPAAYSWVVTPGWALAAAPEHRGWLRDQLLHPPAPPWAAVVNSINVPCHMIWRAPVNQEPGRVETLLDGVPLAFTPAELRAELGRAGEGREKPTPLARLARWLPALPPELPPEPVKETPAASAVVSLPQVPPAPVMASAQRQKRRR